MDKSSATAEQNRRSSNASSKRKRAASDESSGDPLTSGTVTGVSRTSASGETSGVVDSRNSLASSSTSPKPKRSRKGQKKAVHSTVEEEGPGSTSITDQAIETETDSAAGVDKSRGLTDLVDYFPSFQLGRRLTRSLARQIGAASTSPVAATSLPRDSTLDHTRTRINSSSSSTVKESRTQSTTGASLSAANTDSQSSSNLAVKTGCHLSRKTHPSSGATSSRENSRSNAKVGSNDSSVVGKQRENNNLTDSMDQQRNTATGGGGGGGGKKGTGRSNPLHAPSTVPKHSVGDGSHRSATGIGTLIDLERDVGSSSSDSMDAMSGISSAPASGGGNGGGSSSAATTGSGRLHTLLDARNLPMHIFGALGPRMQTLFNRCPSSNGSGGAGGAGVVSSSSGGCGGGRFDPLIQGMQKNDDPSAQLQSLIELCNILVMSNEETLGPNFPVKDTIRCLIKLLQSEQSYDIMTHACRALTYLMEAAPRVTPAVTDSVPLLLDKLQRVECIDVAEQALAALDLLSRRHSKCILMAGGIGACLQHIDFFSLASQRSALQIVANCCLHMTSDDFHFLVDSLPALTQRLNSTDKKTVELVCVLFTRLVESYVHEPDKMRRLCDYGLLQNVQQMIVASPPVLSSSVLVSVIRMMHTLCRQCSELAVRLLRLNAVAAIRFLLMGTADTVNSADPELLARTPQELYELVLLISELLPPLPSDGQLFEVDNWLKACYYYFYQGSRCMYSSLSTTHPGGVDGGGAGVEHAYWAWKDERGLWRPFGHMDNQLLEAAYQAREEEVNLNTFGQQYTIDLVNMIQINDDTGYSRPVQRKIASPYCASRRVVTKALAPVPDPRLELIRNEKNLYEELIRCLLPVLYDIYTSVGGPAVRHECLRCMLRIIYHSDSELLRESLKKEAVSSLLAGMLNSNDLKTIIPALQLCTVLMDKLPDVFHVNFRREGVTHQLRRLATEAVQFLPSLGPSSGVGGNVGLTTASASSSSVDGFFPGGVSSSSLGYGSASASTVSVSGLSSIQSNFMDRSSDLGRDAAGEGVGLNAINSVDQFLSAVSGLPLLRHHRHENHHVHGRHHGFDAAGTTRQKRSPVMDTGSTRTLTAVSTDAVSMESVSSMPAVLPPATQTTTGAAAASTSPGGSTTSSGVASKRHHHYTSSTDTGASSRMTACRGNFKTRRAAAAAASSKQTTGTNMRSIGTRSTRARTSAEVSNSLVPSSSSVSTGTSSSSDANQQHGLQPSAASSFFHNLPFPKWARGSCTSASSVSTTSVGVLQRQASAPGSKPSASSHSRQKILTQQSAGDRLQTASASGGIMSSTTMSSTNSLSLNTEKCITWVREQSKMLMSKYFFDNASGEGYMSPVDLVSSAAQQAANVLERLVALAGDLKEGKTDAVYDLAGILSSPTNVSCFELLQSGLITALTQFLVGGVGTVGETNDQLKSFCKAFFGVQCRTDLDEDGVPTVVIDYHRESTDGEKTWFHPARLLLTKLNVCVSQLEQFPVKVHDLAGASSSASAVGFAGGTGSMAMLGGHSGAGGGPFGLIGHLSGMTGSPSSLRGLNALRFLHSQQIKCHLQRHPEEKRLKQWHRGPIKIDPLAQIATIEKYLLAKGFGRRCNSSNEEISGDDEESSDDEDDEEENSALFLGELSDGTHKLQILISDRVLPYDMTIYQAVRQYGLRSNAYVVTGESGAHTSSGTFTNEWIGPEVWIHTHLLTYRMAPEASSKQGHSTSPSTGVQQTGSSSSSGAGQKASSSSGRSKMGTKEKSLIGGDDATSTKSSSIDFCELKESSNPLTLYLTPNLPSVCKPETLSADKSASSSSTTSTISSQQTNLQDPSLECIVLIRILFGISRYWWALYKDAIVMNFQPLLSLTDFHNTKLSAKVTRQLQDPLTVVAGQLPNWVEQLTNNCPFLFPFEVRQAVFHVVALDRDRALQRLLDSSNDNGGNGGGGSSDRITPRLERRKVVVNREDLLKQTETVLGTMENSRAILEIQYENEVGTGLGPTLEFYALVSRQFQRGDLQLWRGLEEDRPVAKSITDNKREPIDVIAKSIGIGGLSPSPLGRHVKTNVLEKVLSKFRLLGKFLGRSLLDGRILDLPLSVVFYKWLIKEEQTLSWADLADLDPTLHRSLEYLRRQQLKATNFADALKQDSARRAIEEMELDFTVPGYPSLELVKSGKDKLVTLDNLQQYLDLLLHWLLKAGICRQMEAARDCLNALIPLKHLRLFFPEELDQLFCGARSDSDIWEPAALLQALRPDHGYNHDSQPIRWLVDILATRFDDERRRHFVQFITGSPKLPVGGVKNLNPPLTVVRKTDASGTNDAQLPSVMTCVNYLKLPEYSSLELMEQRLLTAISYGRYSFHLS